MQDYSNDTLYHVTQEKNSETFYILYEGEKNNHKIKNCF